MKKIILLGPKHCGKTSVARALGEYIDLDEEITRLTGKTPRQLYNEGVAIFQKAEADSLRQIATCYPQRSFQRLLPATCLAAGGGIIDNPEAVEILKKIDAVKIYLDISAETAWQRISASGELPPFLKTENPKETHRALHEKRAACYKLLADTVIQADGKSPQQIAEEIAGLGIV